jgi:hypothetical protein
MLPLDIPNAPPQYSVMLLAQAGQVQQQSHEEFDRTIGVCQLVSNPAVRPKFPGMLLATNNLGPIGDARNFAGNLEHKSAHWGTAQSSVLQGPVHGRLQSVEKSGSVLLYYIADSGYFGTDTLSFRVTVDGMKLKVVYDLHVVDVDDDSQTLTLCPKPYRKIAYVGTNLSASPEGQRSLLLACHGHARVLSADDHTRALKTSRKLRRIRGHGGGP